MSTAFPSKPRALVSALYCCALLTPLHGLAQTTATLPTVTVTSPDESSLQAPPPQSYKFTAPLLDTPRSITVVPQQVLQEKNVTTLADALRTVPGITFIGGDAAANPSADRPVIRGFESRNSIFVDGMRDSGVQNREAFATESVNVIKGADSVYAGRGAVGGSVDITTKTPQKENFLNGSVGLGTADYKRATLDLNRVLNDGTAFRLNVMGHDANQAGRTDVYSRRWGIAPSISFGMDTPTTVTLSYYHLNTSDMPDFSVPFRASGTPVASPRDVFYGLNGRDFRDGQTDTGQIRIEHRLDGNWKLRNTTQFGRTTLGYVATNPQLVAPAATSTTLSLQAKSGQYATNGIANQTELTGDATLWGLKHRVTAGLELSGEKSLYEGYLVSDAAGNNIRSGGPCTVAYNCTTLGTWNPNNPWTGSLLLNGDMSFPGPATHTRTNVVSAYAFDTVQLDEKWLLSAGLRFDRFDVKAVQAGLPDLSNTSNLVNGQIGVVYKPAQALSLYASYGTSANPPGANAGLGGGTDQLTGKNQDLSPERSHNLEIGAKWDVLDRRLSLTSALFQTEKTNARVTDANGNTVNAGSQRVRGLELGVAGKLTSQWSVFGGYSYLDAITTSAGPASPSASGLPMVMVPKNSFTLWNSYQVLPELTLGAGITAASLVYASVAPTARKWIPGYARFDLSATYRVNKSMDVRLNIQNLTDKHYYSSAYPIYATWAPGRSATVTLNFYQ